MTLTLAVGQYTCPSIGRVWTTVVIAVRPTVGHWTDEAGIQAARVNIGISTRLAAVCCAHFGIGGIRILSGFSTSLCVWDLIRRERLVVVVPSTILLRIRLVECRAQGRRRN